MFILCLISSPMSFEFVTVTPRYLNFSTFSNDKLHCIFLQDKIQAGAKSDVHGVLGHKGHSPRRLPGQGETVNTERYCETLQKLRPVIQNN